MFLQIFLRQFEAYELEILYHRESCSFSIFIRGKGGFRVVHSFDKIILCKILHVVFDDLLDTGSSISLLQAFLRQRPMW